MLYNTDKKLACVQVHSCSIVSGVSQEVDYTRVTQHHAIPNARSNIGRARRCESNSN
jgi:hypothetical protein